MTSSVAATSAAVAFMSKGHPSGFSTGSVVGSGIRLMQGAMAQIGASRCGGMERAASHDPAPWQSPTQPCRSEEHTSELQLLMRISYAVFCLKKKTIYSH